jgi:hypothetical protein
MLPLYDVKNFFLRTRRMKKLTQISDGIIFEIGGKYGHKRNN